VREAGVAAEFVASMSIAFADGKEERKRLAVVGVELAVVAAGEANRANPIFCGVL
jgi:hypothetical protein